MKKSIFYAALFVFTAVSFVGCSEEEEPIVPVDIREAAAGTYNYTSKMYVVAGTALEYMGAETDETGTMIVKKNAANAATIDFFEGAELQFQGNKIAEATNGLVFDVPSQTMKDDGVTINITGYNYFELAGTKYHGAYITATKKIQAAFQFTAMVENVQMTFVIVYEAIKQ